MFAGPNGSGKSTLKSVLPAELLGVYLNPDEIEQDMRARKFLDFGSYGLTVSEKEALPFFGDSSFLISEGFGDEAKRLKFSNGRLDFADVEPNSYLTSVAADFLRQRLLRQGISFTFETVMSHPGKVEFLSTAQKVGYRTCLYFIATDDPEINISPCPLSRQPGRSCGSRRKNHQPVPSFPGFVDGRQPAH